jgi:hypothetical protein
MSSSIQFAELCSNGCLELAQKCYQNDSDLNIYYNGNQAFTGACKNNHMEIAKWFITILPADADYITYFNRALSYGRLELMLFIIDFMPDFDVSDDQHNIFELARSYKHYHISKWLCSVKPDIYTIDSQGIPQCNKEKYKIIREREIREREETWQTILPVLIYGGEIIVFIFIVVFWII